MGTFTISIDTELAWGYCDRPLTPSHRREIELEREAIVRLLALFERYNISATWAVVAHLLIDHCERQGDLWHPEIPRPVDSSKRDWFWQHPDDPNDALWYARDLLRAVTGAKPPQEIASHSFAHLLFDESATNTASVSADLDVARRVHETNGLEFSSFVFPRNVVGFRKLLAESGIRVYRGSNGGGSGMMTRAMRLAAFMVPTAAAVVHPHVDDVGLVDVPGSMLLLGRKGLRRIVPAGSVKRKALKALDAIAGREGVFHLWFHPSNLVHAAHEQFGILEEILRRADALRRNGKIEILPMGRVGERVLEKR